MAFWSSHTLHERLGEIIIEPATPHREIIDCNALQLTVGSEVYISPSTTDEKSDSKNIQQLKRGQSFRIPPGQFAFLVTHENIAIPNDAMGFISMKAKIKLKGLVNVSGFHVDPGFRGRLTFSVFNAGPQSIFLKSGQPAFLMWIASLDRESNGKSNGKSIGKTNSYHDGLDPAIITAISGEVHSFEAVMTKIRDNDKNIREKLHAIEREHAILKWAISIIVGLAIAVASKLIKMP